jgi:hypothetical protein
MATLSPEQLMALMQEIQSFKTQLDQTQAQLAQQQHASATAAATPRAPLLKPAKPDTFDGAKPGNRVDSWLFQLTEYFGACGVISGAERVAYAGSMLRGAASTWWRQRRTQAAAGAMTDITTWDQFCAELRAQFTLINAVKVARDELAALKQTGAVQTYALRFRDITLQIPDITEPEKLDRFTRGLKPRLQRELAIREPANLDDAVRMAERIDVVDFAWHQRASRTTTDYANHQRPEPMELGNIETKPRSAATAVHRFSNSNHPRALQPNLDSKTREFNRKPLTSEERERLRKIGACFKCRQTGHTANECPELRHPNGRAQ